MKITKLNTNQQALATFLHKVYAAGLGRVMQHMLEGEWGILSADSTKLNRQWQVSNKTRIHPKNLENMAILKELLRKQGYGFVQMRGGWIDDSIQQIVGENSLFIPVIKESELQSLGKQFNQSAYVYGINGTYFIKDIEGGILQTGTVAEHFHHFFNDNPQFGFSKVKHHQWAFEPNRSISPVPHAVQPAQGLQSAANAKSQYMFILWEDRPKYVAYEGLVKTMGENVPPGQFLSVYLPLKQMSA
jgi:hypothetical protein